MKMKWCCQVCGNVYDAASGDEDHGIPPGTPLEKLPPEWTCPECGATARNYKRLD